MYKSMRRKKTFEKQDVDALAQIRFDEMLKNYQKTYAGKSKEEINSERAALKDEYLPRMKTYIENGTRAMKALYRDSSEGGTAMFESEGGHYPTYIKAIVGAAFREIADNKRNPGGLLSGFIQIRVHTSPTSPEVTKSPPPSLTPCTSTLRSGLRRIWRLR